MARGLLTLRLMPTTAMAAMVDTDSAATEPTTLATVMEAMARGLLTLRPMPTMVMADTAMVVLATAMASKCQWYDCYSDVYPWICTKPAAGNCNIRNCIFEISQKYLVVALLAFKILCNFRKK